MYWRGRIAGPRRTLYALNSVPGPACGPPGTGMPNAVVRFWRSAGPPCHIHGGRDALVGLRSIQQARALAFVAVGAAHVPPDYSATCRPR